jgi:hypothetical protein
MRVTKILGKNFCQLSVIGYLYLMRLLSGGGRRTKSKTSITSLLKYLKAESKMILLFWF